VVQNARSGIVTGVSGHTGSYWCNSPLVLRRKHTAPQRQTAFGAQAVMWAGSLRGSKHANGGPWPGSICGEPCLRCSEHSKAAAVCSFDCHRHCLRRMARQSADCMHAGTWTTSSTIRSVCGREAQMAVLGTDYRC
jgi:hypothetical protein